MKSYTNPKQGERLKWIIWRHHLSQGKLAEKIGCSQQAVSRYIINGRTIPYVHAKKIADMFGYDVEWILGYGEDHYENSRAYASGQIVTCKECANCFETPNGKRCFYTNWAIEEDDFCSHAERRGSE